MNQAKHVFYINGKLNKMITRPTIKGLILSGLSVVIYLSIIFSGCSKISPISGSYEAKDKSMSALVLDSTLFLMFGQDSMIIYELRIYDTFIFDTTINRVHKVLFSGSLTSWGYELFEMTTKLEPDPLYGNTLMAWFENNESFTLGGLNFYRCRPERGREIFRNWENLFLGNFETKMRLESQNE